MNVEFGSTSLAGDSSVQGYWKLENANDSSSNGYNLSNVNTVTFVAGLYNNAGNFVAASSQHLTIADASCPNLEITGSKTWSVWIKPATVSLQVVMAKVAGTSGVQIFFDTTYIQFYCNGLSTNSFVNSTTSMSAGNWYHVCGVYDSANTKLKIFVNGIKTEVTASGSTTDSNAPFYIGRNDGGAYYNGVIDDAVILNRALSDAEVLIIYNGRSNVRRRLLGVGM